MIKICNNGDSFKVMFDNKEYEVPAGIFEIEQHVGSHILMCAHKWGLPVNSLTGWMPSKGKAIETEKPEVKPIKRGRSKKEEVEEKKEDVIPDSAV